MQFKYEHGQAVRLIRNVRNDGTYGGEDMGTMLMRRGAVGHVTDIGTFLQDQIIYSVHFIEESRLIGCREEELIPAEDPWEPSQFEFRDHVVSKMNLAINGEVVVKQGDIGEIQKIIGSDNRYTGPFQYHVRFSGRTLQVPEASLELAPDGSHLPEED